MSNSAPTVEKLEHLLGLKEPKVRPARIWLLVACAVYATVLVSSIYFFANPGSPAMTLYQATQLVWITTAFGFVVGNSFHAGAFERTAGRFVRAGRKLRAISVVALAAAFPLYFVAAGASSRPTTAAPRLPGPWSAA